MSFPLPTTSNICLGYRFKKLPITSQNWNRAIMASWQRTEHVNRLTTQYGHLIWIQYGQLLNCLYEIHQLIRH